MKHTHYSFKKGYITKRWYSQSIFWLLDFFPCLSMLSRESSQHTHTFLEAAFPLNNSCIFYLVNMMKPLYEGEMTGAIFHSLSAAAMHLLNLQTDTQRYWDVSARVIDWNSSQETQEGPWTAATASVLKHVDIDFSLFPCHHKLHRPCIQKLDWIKLPVQDKDRGNALWWYICVKYYSKCEEFQMTEEFKI